MYDRRLGSAVSLNPQPITVDAEAPRQPSWGLTQAIFAFVIAFVAQNIGGVALALADRPLYEHHLLAFELIAYQFLALGVATAVVLVLASTPGASLSAIGFRNPGWRALAAAPLVVLGVFVGLRLLYALFQAVFPHYGLQGNAKDLFPGGVKGIYLQLIVLVWAGIEAPLVEETLFRGIVFQGIRNFFERRLRPWTAVALGAVLSGTIFGLVHPEPHAWPLLIFVGIVLAYFFQVTRSVYASALVHGLINSVAAFQLFGSS